MLTLPPKHTSPLRVTLHIYNHVIQMSTARCTQTYHMREPCRDPRVTPELQKMTGGRGSRLSVPRAWALPSMASWGGEWERQFELPRGASIMQNAM